MNCRICGRQVAVSDSGQAMPCVCINEPMGRFLRYALNGCINPVPESPRRDDPEEPRQ